MSRKIYVKNQRILDSWAVLIEDACGRGIEIYEVVKKLIQESQVPYITAEAVSIILESSLFKIRVRNYLRVSNERLKGFQIFVGARDYGKDLYVSWYLTCEKKLFKEATDAHLSKTNLGETFLSSLSFFTREELTAYITKIHRCVLKAVKVVMHSLGQDSSKIVRLSTGLLAVS